MSQKKTHLYQYYACLRNKEIPISIFITFRKKYNASMHKHLTIFNKFYQDETEL